MNWWHVNTINNLETESFYQIAREYCEWAEKGSGSESSETAVALNFLSALYNKALALPETTPELPFPETGLDKTECNEVYERFRTIPILHYTEIYDPTVDDQAPVIGDVADDLRDIYVDLKEGIASFERGLVVNAVFIWKNTFGMHWGRHALSALRAIHSYEMKL